MGFGSCTRLGTCAFLQGLLFARTNYMAEICADLIEMVEIVDDFFKFLGPELKAVTGALPPLTPVFMGFMGCLWVFYGVLWVVLWGFLWV